MEDDTVIRISDPHCYYSSNMTRFIYNTLQLLLIYNTFASTYERNLNQWCLPTRSSHQGTSWFNQNIHCITKILHIFHLQYVLDLILHTTVENPLFEDALAELICRRSRASWRLMKNPRALPPFKKTTMTSLMTVKV
ncbi:unnamed protein product [Periconia digitata]|uniref:Uncharacterized protein n=1 Tax=Periconia digitata TaxID=1303443 RepID=A0A9W4UAZ7_9PLEO|nr:unnamed protein product [Periconia digitata]